MAATKDYVKLFGKEIVSEIRLRYSKHESCYTIGRALKISTGIVNKILLQTGCYDPYRFSRSAFYIKAEDLIIEAYSNDEMDYGYSGQSKYTYKSLSIIEKEMYNKI